MQEQTSFNICCLFCLSLLIASPLWSQELEKKHAFPKVEIELSPIVKDGGAYFFNGTRGTFESILVPLTALKDEEINQYIKSSRTVDKVGNWIAIAPMIYVVYEIRRGYYNVQLMQGLILSSMIINQIMFLVEQRFKRKAINRYNDLIFKPQVRMYSPKHLGVGLSIRF